MKQKRLAPHEGIEIAEGIRNIISDQRVDALKLKLAESFKRHGTSIYSRPARDPNTNQFVKS